MRAGLILLALVVLLGGAYYLFKGNAPSDTTPQTEESSPGNGSPSATGSASHDHSHGGGHNPAAPPTPTASLPAAISSFNYKQETENLSRLTKEWPKSKPQLLKNVLAPDVFKENNIVVEPHTNIDILQRQIGAVKVASLRVIVESEKNKSQQLADLDYVIQHTSDETLKLIATEARKAVENGRPFFKDTVKAISNMENP